MSQQELKKAGLKITLPRVKILQILESAEPHHMSAEDIYRALSQSGDDVSLATIYRVLTQFETAGLLKRHNFEDGRSVFELDQGAHHDHLVCLKCSHIEEFVDPTIESQQEIIAKQANFRMTDHNLTIYGICNSCQ